MNYTLAKERNISDVNVALIARFHVLLCRLIDSYTLEEDYYEAKELVRSVEFLLQDLWVFSRDERYHTWINKLRDRHLSLQWEGKQYLCEDTDTVHTLKGPFYEGQFIPVGNGAIDIGRIGAYSRCIGNIHQLS